MIDPNRSAPSKLPKHNPELPHVAGRVQQIRFTRIGDRACHSAGVQQLFRVDSLGLVLVGDKVDASEQQSAERCEL